jgi:hypothetical protein
VASSSVVLPIIAVQLYHLREVGLTGKHILDSATIECRPVSRKLEAVLFRDALFLSARKEQLWHYYTSMAIAGCVIGGFATHRLDRKGGKEGHYSLGESTGFKQHASPLEPALGSSLS